MRTIFVHGILPMLGLSYVSFGQTAKEVRRVPDPDIRLAVSAGLVTRAMGGFEGVVYGDTIRLGELKCGDPQFTLALGRPEFSMSSYLGNDGAYGLNFHTKLGMQGQVHDKCWSSDNPIGAAVFDTSASLGRLNGSDFAIPIHATGILVAAAPPLVAIIVGASIQTKLPLPAAIPEKIRIELPQSDTFHLEFGDMRAGKFVPSGTGKDIPFYVNIGGIPSGTPAVIVVDGTLGTSPRYIDFPCRRDPRTGDRTCDAQADAAYGANVPLWGDNNIGVSVKDRLLFGRAKNGKLEGLVSYLLPIRLSGQFKAPGGKELQFEVVLTDCILQGPNRDVVRFRALPGQVREIRKVKDKTVLSSEVLIIPTSASAKVGPLRFEDAAFKLPVTDFAIRVAPRFLTLRGVNISKALKDLVSPNALALASIGDMTIPDCLYTGQEKFKARRFMCGDPGQKIGWLSLEAGVSKLGVRADVDTTTLRRLKAETQASIRVSPFFTKTTVTVVSAGFFARLVSDPRLNWKQTPVDTSIIEGYTPAGVRVFVRDDKPGPEDPWHLCPENAACPGVHDFKLGPILIFKQGALTMVRVPAQNARGNRMVKVEVDYR